MTKLETNVDNVVFGMSKIERSIKALEDLKYVPGQLVDVKCTVEKIKEHLERNYVSKSEFRPIQKIVYGMVTIIITAVMIAVINLVINKS